MSKTMRLISIFFGVFVVFNLCVFVVNLYEFGTGALDALYIDYGRSYIKEVYYDDDAIHIKASLCIRNRRITRSRMDRLELIIYEEHGNDRNYEHVSAIITSPSFDKEIIILPFWSKQIECVFDLTDFDLIFSLDRIVDIDTYSSYQ